MKTGFFLFLIIEKYKEQIVNSAKLGIARVGSGFLVSFLIEKIFDKVLQKKNARDMI